MTQLVYFTQTFTPTEVTLAGGVLTFGFATNHLLTTGQTIKVQWIGSPVAFTTTVASTPTGTSLTANVPSTGNGPIGPNPKIDCFVTASYYTTGFTGATAAVSYKNNSTRPGVVQSYVTGTGGAAYTLQISLDGSHWIDINTITHLTVTDDTQYTIIDPTINFVRASITSIGAATQLTIMQAS